jgi:hypothetical protein
MNSNEFFLRVDIFHKILDVESYQEYYYPYPTHLDLILFFQVQYFELDKQHLL